ncbi:lysine/arginine/ornithine ABC transporter substrate-binding protein [Azospirillum sp. SYSU D00513]|uniref:lysine/arginine/ornithine ABC transporter substrate-binding protein n=1 Tax=Azospirillum sp. SYSU D00513 TaxID=2812561 RepID=UPI001FFE6348|nr:lysine/arginine/ornithine ABC transporter substrate-binding protein [Azospirillum sp. SYSU D00513]
MFAALAIGAIVAAVGTVAGVADAKDWKKIRIASEGAYPPWNSTDPSGKLIGFEVDLAKDLCARMKAECEFVAQDWDGIIPALQQGKYDAIMSAMTITDERKQVIDFTVPYGTEPSSFGVLKGSPLQSSLDLKVEAVDLAKETPENKGALDRLAAALKGKTVGVQVSTIQANFMEKHLPDVDLRTYDKIENAGIDLVSGRIDTLFGDRSVVEAIAKNEPDKVVLVGPNISRGVLGEGIGLGVRKADADLKALFDKAIQESTKDGVVSKLSVQHFGYDIAVK